MGYFFSKTWPWWLLAAVLAALIAWLLCRWWSRRAGTAAAASGTATGAGELAQVQGLLRGREDQLSRLKAEHASLTADHASLKADHASHVEQLAALTTGGAGTAGLQAEVEHLRGQAALLAEHRSRIDGLNAQVATLTGRLETQQDDSGKLAAAYGRIAELERTTGLLPAAQTRIAELEGRAGQVDALTARVGELEGGTGQVEALKARIAELESAAGQLPAAQSRVAELEADLAHRPVPSVPDVQAGGAALGQAVRLDDLTVVEGIGPKIAELCHEAGIGTWRELAATPITRLREILDAAGPRFQIHDPGTWPRQAGLLADGHWEPFKAWTDALKGGRAAE